MTFGDASRHRSSLPGPSHESAEIGLGDSYGSAELVRDQMAVLDEAVDRTLAHAEPFSRFSAREHPHELGVVLPYSLLHSSSGKSVAIEFRLPGQFPLWSHSRAAARPRRRAISCSASSGATDGVHILRSGSDMHAILEATRAVPKVWTTYPESLWNPGASGPGGWGR